MWQDFKYYRMGLGINMLWNAYPIVTIVRDGFGIGPAGSVATVLFWAVGLVLLQPFQIFQRVYAPNPVLAFFGVAFMALSFIYLNYYLPQNILGYDKVRELLSYAFPLAFLIALCYYPNDKVDKILPVIILFTMVANIGLIYHLLTSPYWTFGERAAIRFSSSERQSNNPHAFASNALYCLLAAAVYSTQVKYSLTRIFCYLCILTSLVVLVFCRTNSSLFSLGLMLFCALLFRGRHVLAATFNKSALFSMVFLITAVVVLIRRSPRLSLGLEIYMKTISTRALNTFYTASGVKLSQTQSIDVDASSVYRVYSYQYIQEMFREGKWGEILVGEGYKSQFMDVPILESLANQGILGILFYSAFMLFLAIYSFLQIIRPTNGLSAVLAYFSFVLLLASVSMGRPFDNSVAMPFMMYIRFLGIKYYPASTNSLSLPVSS